MGLKTPYAADAATLEQCWADALGQLHQRAHHSPALAPYARTIYEFLSNSGKRFRPRLCLGAFRVFRDCKSVPLNVAQAAIGLELFHSFALIHDDLIDGSPTRRGQPSLHRRLREALEISASQSEKLALLAGDLLFGMAWEALSRLGNPVASTYFARVTQDTGWGEALEIVNASKILSNVSREAIESTYLFKTTRYSFEAPLTVGAMAAGAPGPIADVMHRLAEPLGLAFQAENDLHEIERWLDGETRPSCDLKGGVKTLVLKEASARLEPQPQARLDALLQNPAQPDAMAELARLVERSGAIQVVREIVREQFEAAHTALESDALAPAQREGLASLVALVRENLRHSESLTEVV
ncbi:MAG: polyprenyl synthetase family protein [Opitutales bacterium]